MFMNENYYSVYINIVRSSKLTLYEKIVYNYYQENIEAKMTILLLFIHLFLIVYISYF